MRERVVNVVILLRHLMRGRCLGQAIAERLEFAERPAALTV